MAKKNTLTLTQEELQALIAGAVAQALASQAPTQSASEGEGERKRKGKGKAKLVEFTKTDGSVVKCTEAQAKAWEDYRNRSRKSLDEVKAEFNKARDAYKPSQALVKALKANPTMTRKEAKAYGFVGTSNDLWNLKYGTNGVVRKGTTNR